MRIPDDVNLSRSGSFDTGYEGLDDATSGEGSQGRRHKDYLDKSINWFNKEPREKLSPNFMKMPKVFLIQNKNQYL